MAKPMYYWNGTAWEAVAPVVPQSPIAYQASAPSSPSTGDLWIDSDQDLDSYQRQLVRYKFNATGGETSLSGTDANGATLSYTPGAEQVYLNGALLVRGSDYVATNGTSITSLAALSASDVVEIFAYVAFNPANTYTQSQVDGLVGLVHLHTETFSAASSVSINDVFSATYSNYKIISSLKGSTTATTNMRLRASGTDLTSSSYIAGKLYVGAGASLAFGSENNIAGDTMTVTRAGTADTDAGFVMDLLSPFETGRKQALSVGSGQWVYWLAYHIQSASSYDGFTIYPASGTITGTVSVYGYKE